MSQRAHLGWVGAREVRPGDRTGVATGSQPEVLRCALPHPRGSGRKPGPTREARHRWGGGLSRRLQSPEAGRYPPALHRQAQAAIIDSRGHHRRGSWERVQVTTPPWEPARPATAQGPGPASPGKQVACCCSRGLHSPVPTPAPAPQDCTGRGRNPPPQRGRAPWLGAVFLGTFTPRPRANSQHTLSQRRPASKPKTDLTAKDIKPTHATLQVPPRLQ